MITSLWLSLEKELILDKYSMCFRLMAYFICLLKIRSFNFRASNLNKRYPLAIFFGLNVDPHRPIFTCSIFINYNSQMFRIILTNFILLSPILISILPCFEYLRFFSTNHLSCTQFFQYEVLIYSLLTCREHF